MTLRVLHRLNAKHLTDEYIKAATGELLAKASDFQGPLDVVPVSDPNIFSEAQRFAQMQAIAQRASAMPQLYNQRAVEELFLERMKVPNAKDLLNPKPEAIELNAVNENLALTLGRPTAAFPLQDHLAHIQVHLDYLASPIFGSNPLIAPVYIPGVLQHIKEHMVYWYSTYIYEQASAATGVPLEQLMSGKDPEISAELDRTLAIASQRYMPDVESSLQGLPPIIQQAQQMLQQFQPPKPADPAQVLMAETQRKMQADQAKMQTDQARLGIEQSKAQSQVQIDQSRLDLERMRLTREAELDAIKQEEHALEVQSRILMNREDNMTAKELAVFEVENGIRTPYSTGRGINP
jgi:hypothetical protein